MVNIVYSHAKISGIVTVVSNKFINLDDERQYYANDISKIERLKNTVGLQYRSIAGDEVTASDFCEQAAIHLFEQMNISKTDIDALIFVSDAADYKCPPTACILQGKLDLPCNCASFDINHGCAGYVYGLNMASALLETGCFKKILLLVGDTKSKTINIKDRTAAPIFGDGGSATLLEYSEEEILSYFTLGTEGKKYENIIIPAGGARLPCSEKTSVEYTDNAGNTRSLNNFYMNGRNVFDFTMSQVPQNIINLLEFAHCTTEDIDYAIFHQANKNIINNIALRVGFNNLEKVPSETLKKYGNLAVASIPCAINDQLNNILQNKRKRILLAGFGVGLSWGMAIVYFDNTYCPNVFNYNDNKGKKQWINKHF